MIGQAFGEGEELGVGRMACQTTITSGPGLVSTRLTWGPGLVSTRLTWGPGLVRMRLTWGPGLVSMRLTSGPGLVGPIRIWGLRRLTGLGTGCVVNHCRELDVQVSGKPVGRAQLMEELLRWWRA